MKTVSADFASQMWQRILFDKHRPGKINRRHFEVCTLFYLTQELRTGDVAVISSELYANLHDQLLSWQACEPLVADYCEQAGLPATAPAFTAALKQKLTATAAKMDAGYPDNADLAIDAASGKIVLTPRKARTAASLRRTWRRRSCAVCRSGACSMCSPAPRTGSSGGGTSARPPEAIRRSATSSPATP